MRRWLVLTLAGWLALAPALVSVASAEELLARYHRGELTLAEYEAARVARSAREREASQPAARPLSPETADVEVPAPEPEGTPKAGTLGRIGAWIRETPGRLVRRWQPERQGFETAAEAVAHVENSPVPAYTANAAQREAESDWKRPVTVTARGELDTIQTVIERVIGFGGLATLSKALAGNPEATRAVAQAGQVVARLTPSQRQALTRTLNQGALKGQVASFLGGAPTSGLGKVVKDSFGNNMVLAVAASGLVSYFLNDGLDLDTLKDHLVALNAIEERRSWREDLIGVPAETVALYHMVNASGSLYEKIWNKVATGSGGLASWVQRTEQSLAAFGGSIVKKPPAHLAAKAAELGKSAQALGLPGVSAATALTFKGLLEAGFSGLTIGVIGIPLINGAWKVALGMPEGMYVGGGRDRFFARYDLPYNYYQRTGDSLRDGIEERYWATKSFIEEHEKFPGAHFLNYFFRVFGGYVGAVVASSMVIPVGIPSFAAALVVSAVFSEGGRAFGQWLGSKIDTSPRAYRRLRRKNAQRVYQLALAQGVEVPARAQALQALAALDQARARAGVRTPGDLRTLRDTGGSALAELEGLAAAYQAARAAYLDQLSELAVARGHDYERLMKVAQVNRNIRFVRRLEDLQLEREGDYLWIVAPDGWRQKASPRFDFVDARGHRGVFDPRSQRVLDVGAIEANNGRRIVFLDEAGVRVEGGRLVAPRKPESADGNVVVTSNGVVLERTTNAKTGKTEWLVRGYGGEYDLVLRESGRRFQWDGEHFQEVAPPTATATATAAVDAADRDADARTRAALPQGQGVEDALGGALRDLARYVEAQAGSPGLRYSAALAAGRD